MRYDPENPPDAATWLALDEGLRIEDVSAYHERVRAQLPNARLHAAFHVIVENQLAEGIAIVRETLDRLLAEGLDRHDAIHAISSVLVKHVWSLMREAPQASDPHQPYFRDLQSLAARSWLDDAHHT